MAKYSKELFDFYEREYKEQQKKRDEYILKTDKHLKELIDDKVALEAELNRRGEKISNLQKSLVDLQLTCFHEREQFLEVAQENERLKINDKKLHENIQHLLNTTKEKEFRDRIIYTLEPDVEIAVQGRRDAPSLPKTPTEDLLRKEIEVLHSKLSDYAQLAKQRPDGVIYDCRRTLLEAKERILELEAENKHLNEKLKEAEKGLHDSKLAHSKPSKKDNSSGNVNQTTVEKSIPLIDLTSPQQRRPLEEKHHNPYPSLSAEYLSNIQTEPRQTDNKALNVKKLEDYESQLNDVLQTLEYFSQLIYSLFNSVRKFVHTQAFARAAKQPRIDEFQAEFATHADIVKFQETILQSLSVVYNIKKKCKCLLEEWDNTLDSSEDIHNLFSMLEDLSVEIADVYTWTNHLSQATFFRYLSEPKKHFRKYGVKAEDNLSRYVSELKRMESNLKSAISLVEKATATARSISTKFAQKMHVMVSQVDEQPHSHVRFLNRSNIENHAPVDRAINFLRRPANEANLRQYFPNATNPDLTIGLEPSSSLNEQPSMTESEFEEALIRVGPPTKQSKRVGQKETVPKTTLAGQSSIVEPSTAAAELKKLMAKIDKIPSKRNGDTKKSDKVAKVETTIHVSEQLKLRRKDNNSQKKKDSRSRPSSQGRTESDDPALNDSTANIDETLRKIQQLGNKADAGHSEEMNYLIYQVNSLTESLKEIRENPPQNLEDKFLEYTSEIVKRLETVTKQSREAVIAAEAQITSLRQDYQKVSKKLIDTEELLRESVHECLNLKQQIKISEHRELSKPAYESKSQSSFASGTDESKTSQLRDSYGSKLRSNFDSRTDEVLLNINLSKHDNECFYCKQGGGHKECQKEIKDLRNASRKLATENKILELELKEERKLYSSAQEIINKISTASALQTDELKEALRRAQAQHSSALERMNFEKKRVKDMERYRRFELEGLKTEVKNLKAELVSMEKKLRNAALIFEQDQKDIEMLNAVYSTAQQSKTAVSMLKRLKSKLYEIETDIKNL